MTGIRGCDGGGDASRRAPLWIPAFAGMTLGVCGPASAGGGGGGASCPAPPPPRGCGPPFTLRFPSGRTASPAPHGTLGLDSCLRGNDAWRGALRQAQGERIGKRPDDGEWGMRWGRRRAAPRAPALGSRVRGNDGGGSRRFEGGWGGGAPPGAPLDSCLRRNDEVCRRYDEVCGGIDVAGSEVCRRARLVRGSRRGCATPVPWRLRLALGRPRCRWGGRRLFARLARRRGPGTSRHALPACPGFRGLGRLRRGPRKLK